MNGSLGYEPYSEYKPSGIDWLGDVPEHWVVRRLKTLCGLKSGDGITAESIELSGEYPVYGGNGLRGYTSAYTHHGDFVLIGRQGALCGNIHIARSKFWASEHAVVATLDAPHIVEWFAAILEAMNLNQYSIAAAQPGLSVERVLNLSLPVPPLAEQTSVVRYLDHADERIRRAISAKERLIGLLTEQRQAVIHRAVTRGLNPNVRLKHSGVEWLGDVPEHWEVRRIKSFSVVKRGASPRPIDDPRYFDENGEYAWVRISDVTASNRYLQKTTQRLSEIGQALSVRIEPGNMFLSIAGSVGKPIITKIKCCIHDGFVYFPQFKGDVEFLYRVLSTEGPFAKLGKLGTQLNLNTDTVGSIYIGWPPDEEQKEIVFFLDAESRQIDTAIDKAQRQIDLLREYRTRLIADLVTGRVDVRGTVGDEVELPVS